MEKSAGGWHELQLWRRGQGEIMLSDKRNHIKHRPNRESQWREPHRQKHEPGLTGEATTFDQWEEKFYSKMDKIEKCQTKEPQSLLTKLFFSLLLQLRNLLKPNKHKQLCHNITSVPSNNKVPSVKLVWHGSVVKQSETKGWFDSTLWTPSHWRWRCVCMLRRETISQVI